MKTEILITLFYVSATKFLPPETTTNPFKATHLSHQFVIVLKKVHGCAILIERISQPGRSILSQIISLMVVLTLALVSCVSVDQSDREIPDRWSSAKCPPIEICGPQIDPETLVIAWLDASQNSLCTVLTKYTSPDRSEIIPIYCGAVDFYEIDAISVNEVAAGENDRPNQKEVTIQGRLEFTLDGENYIRSNWSFLIEEIAEKWFVIDGYH